MPQVIYDNELGGADEAALQEAALRQRAERDPAFYGDAAGAALGGGGPGGAAASGAEASSWAAKSTASGGVRDAKFFDLDVAFWQLARQQSLAHNAFDSSTVPHFGAQWGWRGRHEAGELAAWRSAEGCGFPQGSGEGRGGGVGACGVQVDT